MPDIGLSKNDELFIDEYFNNGFNQLRAYETVFGKTKKSAKFASWRLMSRNEVKLEVEKRFQEIRDANVIKREEITFALKDLMNKCIEEGDKPNLLKTIDTINKMQGNYTLLIDANISQNIKLTIPGLDPDKNNDEEDD